MLIPAWSHHLPRRHDKPRSLACLLSTPITSPNLSPLWASLLLVGDRGLTTPGRRNISLVLPASRRKQSQNIIFASWNPTKEWGAHRFQQTGADLTSGHTWRNLSCTCFRKRSSGDSSQVFHHCLTQPWRSKYDQS